MKKRKDCFFGLHFDYHANRNSVGIGKNFDDKTLAKILDEVKPDFVQCDVKGHPGYSSYPTKKGNPAPRIEKNILKKWREITAAKGVLLYGHYSGVMDMDAATTHPQWAVVNKDGTADKEYTSVFGDYAKERMIPQLIELATDYGLNGVWCDGECWGARLDYSERTLELFREKTGKDGLKEENTEEYTEFCRQGFRDYLNTYITEVKKKAPDFEIASNWAFSSQMPEKVNVPVDFISGDLWPTNGVNSARLDARILAGQNKTWDIMSWGFSFPNHYQKGAKQICQEAAAVISQGGGFQLYNKQDVYSVVQDEWMIGIWAQVADFCRVREKYCHNKKSANDFCVLYSTRAYYSANGTRLFGGGGEYNDDVKGLLNCLLDCGYAVDVVLSQNVKKGTFEKYGIIFVSNLKDVEKEIKDELLHYAANGGKVVIKGSDTVNVFATDLNIKVLNTVKGENVKQLCVNGNRVLSTSGYSEIKTDGEILETMLIGTSKDGKITGNPPPTISYDKKVPESIKKKYGKGEMIVIPFDFGFAYENGKSWQLMELCKESVSFLYNPKLSVSSAFVECNITTDGVADYIHIVNIAGQHDSDRVKTYDVVPLLYGLKVKYSIDRKIKNIVLQPENAELNFTCENGNIVFEIDKLEIYSIAVIYYL